MKRLYYLLFLALFVVSSCKPDEAAFPHDSTYFLGQWELGKKSVNSTYFQTYLTFFDNGTFERNVMTEHGPATYPWSYDEQSQELTLQNEAYKVLLMEKSKFSIQSSYSGTIIEFYKK